MSFYNDRVKQELYQHLYSVEYQDYILDFLYEVYYQLVTEGISIGTGYYDIISGFMDKSSLNEVIKAECVVGKDTAKDNIINVLMFLRANNVAFDNAILTRRNMEIKLDIGEKYGN